MVETQALSPGCLCLHLVPWAQDRCHHWRHPFLYTLCLVLSWLSVLFLSYLPFLKVMDSTFSFIMLNFSSMSWTTWWPLITFDLSWYHCVPWFCSHGGENSPLLQWQSSASYCPTCILMSTCKIKRVNMLFHFWVLFQLRSCVFVKMSLDRRNSYKQRKKGGLLRSNSSTLNYLNVKTKRSRSWLSPAGGSSVKQTGGNTLQKEDV